MNEGRQWNNRVRAVRIYYNASTTAFPLIPYTWHNVHLSLYLFSSLAKDQCLGRRNTAKLRIPWPRLVTHLFHVSG